MITIAIPVYNRAEKVRSTLQSVAAQTYRPLRVVLVDNNSTDGTLDTLKEWKAENEGPDFTIEVLSEDIPGPSAARNKALSTVNTEWTLFFDSDDIMPRDHIAKITEAIRQNPNAGVIGWDRLTHRIDGKVVRRPFVCSKYPQFDNITRSIMATQAYAARTDLFRRTGGWDNSLKYGEDLELGNRILAFKPVIAAVPGHYVTVYEGNDSISHTAPDRLALLWESLTKIRENLPENHRHWADMHMVNTIATVFPCVPEGKKVFEEIIAYSPFVRRQLWRLFNIYGRHGGRGAARIYRLLSLNTLRL